MKPLFAALLLIACGPLVMAQGTYTQIDVPGADAQTYCYGINGAGDVVGYYVDSSSVVHGFVLSGGVYTTIDYPGAYGTVVTGINDNGQLVGSTTAMPVFGFVYNLANQTFTKLLYPDAFQTYAYAINDSGAIAGYYQPYRASGSTAGFVTYKRKYTQIDPPGAHDTSLEGISSQGNLVGSVETTTGSVNFEFAAGKYRGVTIPNAPSALVLGISPAGNSLVGYYKPATGTTAGFLYENNVLQELEFPGSTDTGALGVNSSGEVVGFFINSLGAHGFTWTPPAADEKK